MLKDKFVNRYPRQTKMKDLDLTVRVMTRDDCDAIVAFANDLPAHDRLYLQRDLTDADVVDALLAELDADKIAGIVAEAKNDMLGYGMMIPSEEAWSQHVAEIRVSVAVSARGKGIGRILTQEAFAIALACDVKKLMARMTPDQKGAIAAFEGLGFKPEGLMRDHIIDPEGSHHDLLVMGHDVEGFQMTLRTYGIDQVLG